MHNNSNIPPAPQYYEMSEDTEALEPTESKKSVSDKLMNLALDSYTFVKGDDGQPYALPLAENAARHVVIPFENGIGNGVGAKLSHLYYGTYGKTVNASTLSSVLQTLKAKAQEGDTVKLHLRVAVKNGVTYIDTARTDNNVITIDAQSWNISNNPIPVCFMRHSTTHKMRLPKRSTDTDLLFKYLNVTEEDKPLVLAWLVTALINEGKPTPILGLFGEQGTAKTTATKILGSILDPSDNKPDVLAPPSTDERLEMTLYAKYVVPIDNMSSISKTMSDTLCRTATGGTTLKRTLYTAKDVTALKIYRPVALNGIGVGALRGDLAERFIRIELERIPDDKRRPEAELWKSYIADEPEIMGALFALASETLAMLPTVKTDSLPRMADFARILIAVDMILHSCGYQTYLNRVADLLAESADSDPFISTIVKKGEKLEGTAKELLEVIEWDGEGRQPKSWPKTSAAVTTAIRRAAPQLRQLGWDVKGDRNRTKTYVWRIIPPKNEENAGVFEKPNPAHFPL